MDKYTLKTVFQKSFLGLVWRIEVDTATDMMAVETRDKDTGNPSFSVFHYTTGTSLIQEIPYGDRNWGLAGVTNGKVILKAFGHAQPESAGITCMDIESGRVLWEQFNYTLLAIEDRQLVVRHRNFAHGYEQRLDVFDGNLTQFNNSPDKPTDVNIVLPQWYTGEIPVFLENYAIHGEIFHCQIGPKNVWAFHEMERQTYRVRLFVSSGLDVLAKGIVLSGLVKILPEIFFVIGKQLFLIGHNKREIVSYLV